jgi:hypothetical protein
VAKLSGVSREILDGVSTVVKRFEEQTESLTEATRHLSEVNRQIETTVEERRPALESLASGLRSRSEELDGMMRSFTRIISETLKTAEERATAVSRMLTENTASATKGVIENFENLNRTAGTESRKAAEAVREANRSLIEEMTSSIGEASKRFNEAAKEMRGATRELQNDLDETRTELKKGVLDLPEEARESTEAMRRVVGDQIKALSELSEIIARHGKTLDVSSPTLGEHRMATSRPALAPQRVVAASAQPAWQESAAEEATEEPPAQVARLVETAPPAAPQRTPEVGRRNGNGNGGNARPTPMRPAAASSRPASGRPAAPPPRVPPPAPPIVAASEPAAEEGGWVSDLLRRASREEEPAPTPQRTNGPLAQPPTAEAHEAAAAGANGNGSAATVAEAPIEPEQPLGVLSVDIARAIDHNASIELWERHGRGEHNVFTRRLYTLQGQQTFDEIRKKYQRDEQFRSAVDRYVADFEKLLSEVTRTRDKAAGDAYLVSDTGKVYTMLAHASGRFD